jgi:condensin complex subunit 1
MDAFDLQDELQAVLNDDYSIPNEHDIRNEDPRTLLATAVAAVARSSDAITDPNIFDIYRSLLKHTAHVPGPLMSKLLDSISSGMLAQVESALTDVETEDQQTCIAHKTSLEMYAFLLQWCVSAVEKVKPEGVGEDEERVVAPAAKPRRGRGGKATGRSTASRTAAAKQAETWTWVDQIPPTLALISKVLRLKTQRIWTTTAERDNFITCVVHSTRFVPSR